MNQPDRLEVYEGDQCIAALDSAHAPAKGDGISIRGKWYVVVARSYSVDYADRPRESRVSCNIRVEAVP